MKNLVIVESYCSWILCDVMSRLIFLYCKIYEIKFVENREKMMRTIKRNKKLVQRLIRKGNEKEESISQINPLTFILSNHPPSPRSYVIFSPCRRKEAALTSTNADFIFYI